MFNVSLAASEIIQPIYNLKKGEVCIRMIIFSNILALLLLLFGYLWILCVRFIDRELKLVVKM